jgi:hypothetical protein
MSQAEPPSDPADQPVSYQPLYAYWAYVNTTNPQDWQVPSDQLPVTIIYTNDPHLLNSSNHEHTPE